jgi:hypothetical protein
MIAPVRRERNEPGVGVDHSSAERKPCEEVHIDEHHRSTWRRAAGFIQNPCPRTCPLADQERLVREEIQLRIDESIEADEGFGCQNARRADAAQVTTPSFWNSLQAVCVAVTSVTHFANSASSSVGL